MEDDLVFVPDAARELEVTRYTVWKHITTKRLPARKYGRDWVIRREDLDAFKKHRPKPGRPRKDTTP